VIGEVRIMRKRKTFKTKPKEETIQPSEPKQQG
jgi:hypothetical protein